jgi:transcription-repair coupling factor (superfamily II helicase)
VDVFDAIRSDTRLDALARLLTADNTPVAAEGLWGSAAPITAVLAAKRLGRPLLLVTAHPDDADDARDDLETLLGWTPELLPQLETLPREPAAQDELAGERLRLCVSVIQGTKARRQGTKGRVRGSGFGVQGSGQGSHEAREPRSREGDSARDSSLVPHHASLTEGDGATEGRIDAGNAPAGEPPPIVVAPILALMQPVPSPEAIAARSTALEVGDTVELERLERWLADHGFQKCEQVEVPGDFARRGGIVDIYSNGHADPVRIEFFGDEIESIRLFSAGTQRSSHTLQSVQVPAFSIELAGDRGALPTPDGAAERPAPNTGRETPVSDDESARPTQSETTGFLRLLPPDTIIAFHEPSDIQELGRTLWQRLGEPAGMIPPDAVFRTAASFSQLHLRRFSEGGPWAVTFDIRTLPPFEPKAAEAIRTLCELAGEMDVVVLCDTKPEEERFRELLSQPASHEATEPRGREGPERHQDTEARRHEGEAPPDSSLSTQHATLRIQDSELGTARIRSAVGLIHRGFVWGKTAYIPHHELFRRTRPKRTLRRIAPARPIDTFFDLNAGDHVVHVLHGIGRFLGLKSIERQGRTDEYLAIEFADKAVVHVPVSQIHFVQKYVGGFRGRPTLSKIGGAAWKRTKERVAEAVTDLAAELLAIQAERSTRPGIAYPQDTTWQREFEGSFVYTETEDQLRALDEIKNDMSRPQPMDRLLCGDVGFGKTELAIRSAFKVVEYGKQVAVLVPTTVLAEQHYQTFRDRMADYPFSIEVLSRFRTRGEQSRIAERARKGQIDILIGTHRLLSGDVRFADLGLVVIDEEQRFGVEAKETLKRLRATVDVLTLSATPIPRTLHLAMLGIRDISSLATPPIDRRSIVTQVRMWDDALIRDAVLRELNRDGQAYFVHNFVRDIDVIANHVRAIVPEARVVAGHGQMSGSELEAVMLAFLRREADVLVSTNIIESGIDIPTANTMFINRAERFGLADLHQLRGRVGRSKHRAYCYLLLSPKHPVQDLAARRLKAIEQYSELGAGFQIAMRDLEIRGTGNILGAEQSGHIDAVGYEMYCQLLDQAVRRLKNEPAELYRPVNLELGISATISRAYIRSDRQRMEVYKRLTNCRTAADLEALTEDVRDAFGPPPEELLTLLALAEIRVLAAPWGIRSMVLDGPDVVFSVDDLQMVQPLLADGPGSPRVPDPKTVHWRLPKRLLAPTALLNVLRAQLISRPSQPATI